jgi:hypothetical protein
MKSDCQNRKGFVPKLAENFLKHKIQVKDGGG